MARIAEPGPRPDLKVLPRRRRAVGLAMTVGIMLFLALLGVAAFQTMLAQRQLKLDRVEAQAEQARSRYDDLRSRRAQLRSPDRLAEEAARLGMVPGRTTTFVTMPVDIAVQVAISTGGLEPAPRGAEPALGEYEDVKQILGDAR